jgi:Secretion system C-terminal sorting domain
MNFLIVNPLPGGLTIFQNMLVMRGNRYWLFILGVIAFCTSGYGQKYDRHWLGGHGTVFVDTALSVLMRFEDDGITFHKIKTKFAIETGVIAMSNGNAVVTWDGEVMVGGKGFNQGATNDDFGTAFGDTVINDLYNPYTYQVLPDPYDDSIYYLIHAFIHEGVQQPWFIESDRMQISKIDMGKRGGRGEVVYKNRYFDEEVMGAGFALIRHGNGRDWWVVLRKQDGLEYKAILLHRDSVVTRVRSKVEGLGTEWFDDNDWWNTSLNLFHASLDGTMLVDTYGDENIKLLSFDRCNGEVKLLDTIYVGIIIDPESQFPANFFSYIAYQFSPSGRFFYGISPSNLAQWDLEAEDIEASKVIMGHPWSVTLNADGQWHNGYGGFTVFAPGPDGKLYNLRRGIHSVIEYPDEKCPACGLCAGWDQGPPPSCLGVGAEYNLYSGWYPNYRLGALAGSACDTIRQDTVPPPPPIPVPGDYGVNIWPNPASGQVTIEITLPEYESGTAAIEVVDMLGRVLHRHQFAPYAYLYQMDVPDWASGVYNIVLRHEGRLRATGRLVVAR